ncbi:MAG: hypothetical protein QXK73_00785 [Candidatus Bathyarchaeia archaeon]
MRHLKFGAPPASIQKAILNTLYRLNGHEARDNLLSLIVGSDIEIILEVGVANGLSFDYLDTDTLNNLLRAINEKSFHLLDFLLVIRYYKLKSNRRIALRFDFFLLRFLFDEGGGLNILAFHERGLQRISAKELIRFLVKETRLELSAKRELGSSF